MTVFFLGYHQANFLVASELKRRGHRTVLVEIEGCIPAVLPDYLAPFTSAFDAEVEVPGWDDLAAVRAAVERHTDQRGMGVYTHVDEACPTVAALRMDVGIPTTPPETVRLLVDKLWVRSELVRLGRSRLRVVANGDLDQLASWPFPGRRGFVKNVIGAGGYGVRGVKDLASLQAALRALKGGHADAPSLALAMRASRRRMLEEAADGTLVSFEAIISRGTCLKLGFTRPHRLEADIGEREPRPMPGCVHPYRFPEYEKKAVFLADTLSALGYTDGPVHIEAILTPDGGCEIIDLNPRFAGAHCLWAMNAARNEQVEELLADWAVGRVSVDTPAEPTAVACLQYFLAPPGEGRLESVVLPSAPDAVWSAQLKQTGLELLADPIESGWIGGYIVKAETEPAVLAIARSQRQLIRINGRSNVLF